MPTHAAAFSMTTSELSASGRIFAALAFTSLAGLGLMGCDNDGMPTADASVEIVAQADNAGRHDAILNQIKLPAGFRIGVFAEVPGARSLSVAEDGTVYVGQMRGDSVFSAKDDDGDGVADTVIRLARGFTMPNGVAVRGDELFLALNGRVLKWQLPDGDHQTLFDGLPAKSHHGWRYAKFGPDGRLYVSVGVPCNICQPRGLEGTILAFDPDVPGEPQIIASGIRNSVGFDWHPQTGVLYFTDNGADSMGDDVPADEFNKVTAVGEHFGFPWRGGASVPLIGFENQLPPGPVSAPVVEFQAHVAALGVHFYSGAMLPAAYRGDGFVAQHGSWNRSVPVGYRVMRVRFDAAGEVAGHEVFADGWRSAGRTLGRPVDIAELPDGSVLVSDDDAGLIYRIWFDG